MHQKELDSSKFSLLCLKHAALQVIRLHGLMYSSFIRSIGKLLNILTLGGGGADQEAQSAT